ncbi:hypothetical protein Mapa_009948 [Marchantia paleacea]|nr:hypothetical protein Mapa_009948 [Marchantia paleacea]
MEGISKVSQARRTALKLRPRSLFGDQACFAVEDRFNRQVVIQHEGLTAGIVV